MVTHYYVPRAHLYFIGVFYLIFRRELLILLIRTTFSGLLQCPCFLLHFVKKCASQKSLTPTFAL